MNLTEILDKASELHIAVVGDLIIDRYIDGTVDRISPEAPVPVLRITGTRENPGGAGNVVANLKGLGCQVNFFHQPSPPIKTRVMSGSHHIIRMDDEDDPVWMKYDDYDYDISMDYGLEKNRYNCVVISDYGKGAISRDVTSKLIRKCNEHSIPVVVDTKYQFNLMHHATVVKCNKKEWWNQDMPFPESPWGWMDDYDVHHLVITDGANGMRCYTKNGSIEYEGVVEGERVEVCDPCGAGDTVTAVIAMCISFAGKMESMSEACLYANLAASEVCKHPGVFPINKDLLIKRYEIWKTQR